MNWDSIAGHCRRVVGKVQEQWGALSSVNLDLGNGRCDMLVGKI